MENLYQKVLELSKKVSLSLLLSIFGIMIGLLAWDSFRNWSIEMLGGYTAKNYDFLKRELSATMAGQTLRTDWEVEIFNTEGHLACTNQISKIIETSYGFKVERFSSEATSRNYSGSFFSGLNGPHYIHGSFACADFNIAPDLSYTQTVLVVGSLSKKQSKRLKADINNEIIASLGPSVWPPDLIEKYYDRK